MSDTHQNVESLKQRYARWDETKGACVEEWMEILDDSIDFRSLAMAQGPGTSFTKPASNKSEVREYFAGLLDQWEMEHYTVDDFVAQDDRVCVIGSTAWTNKQTGKRVETPKVDVWRFKNGKAVAFFEYYDTAALIAGSSQ